MKRVCIDARTVGPVMHGMARYTCMLLKGLASHAKNRQLPYEPVVIRRRGFKPSGAAAVLEEFENIEADCDFLSPREIFELPGILKKTGADLYHSPTFSSLLWCPCPWIVTVHELNHLHFGGFSQKLYYAAILKRFVRGAACVATVSDFSRKEIAAWSGVREDSILLAYNGVEFEAAPAALPTGQGLAAGKYFICVANPKPHKNVKLLVDAYLAYRHQAGPPGAWPLVLTMNGSGGAEGVIFTGPLLENETATLVQNAGALFSPSLYEGFGLPPVEAALAGIPVVASNIGPHLEGLAGALPSGATMHDPHDFHGWVSAFHRGAKGDLPRAGTGAKAAIAARFAPLGLGKTMDQAYRRVLGEKT